MRVEAASVEELARIINELEGQLTPLDEGSRSRPIRPSSEFPSIAGAKSCKDSITQLLASRWGKAEPRIEFEITEAMKANSIYYPRGTISAVLAQMAKGGEIRRVGKREGAFAYVLVSDGKGLSKIMTSSEFQISENP